MVTENPPSVDWYFVSKPKLWTRDFVLAWGVSLFLSIIFYVLMTSMAGYAVTRFGVGQSVAGLASSAFVIGSVAGRVFAGKYMDFIGRKRLLLIVLAGFTVCAALYFVAAPAWVLIVLRLVHGVGYGFGHTALMTVAQSLLPDQRRGEGTGYFAMSTSLATAIGPLLAVLLVSGFGYAWLFTAILACSAAGLLIMVFVRVPERTPTAAEAAEKWRISPSSIVEPRALPVAAVIFVAGVSFSAVLAFVDGYTKAIGLGNASGLFFLVYAAATLLSRLFVGRIQDRHSDAVVVYPVLVLFALGLSCLAAAHSGVLVLASGVLMGIGFGSAMSALQTVAVKLVAQARIGVAVSTFFLLLDIGTGGGPVLLGALQPVLGDRGIYYAAAVLVAVAIGLYAWASARRSPR